MDFRPIKIALFDAVGTYFSAPTLRCMLEEFDKSNCEVDAYVRLGAEHLGEVSRAKAQFFPVSLRAWSGDWESTIRHWKWYVKYRGYRGSRALDSGCYDLTIGLNPEGVIAAHRYWKRTKTPFVYLSFEMFFRDELRQKGLLRFKEEEIAASLDASFVIATDKWRAKLLSEENGVPLDKIACLPVAPRGGPLQSRTDYLRQKLGIPADKTVVLHAGSFGQFTCADKVIATLPEWPVNFVFVINTHYNPQGSDPFIARLRESGEGRVYVTTGNRPAAEFDELVQSADIGLALYQPARNAGENLNTIFGGRNIQTMGLSSGKLATFARNGVPMVCSGNPVIKEYLKGYGFGQYADSFVDVPRCLTKLGANREDCSAEARRFFDEQLDFNRFWPDIWCRILKDASRKGA